MFVRVKLPNDEYAFLDVTRNIGEALPFEKPVATCAMEVSKNVVSFSLIHLNRHSTEIMRERDLSFPAGATSRLARKGNQRRNMGEDELIVAVDELEPVTFQLERKENGAVVIPENGPTFTLSRRPSRVDLYIKSPGTGRVLAVGFGGHFGSDGTTESVGRAAGKVLRSLSGLGAWKALSGIVAVEMPRPLEQRGIGRVSTPDNLSRSLRVSLWDAAGTSELAAGEVQIEIDMVNADPATQRFLFHVKPDDSIAPAWNSTYSEVLKIALDRTFETNLGAEMESMVYGIVLGELNDDQVRTMAQALHAIQPMDLTPSQWRVKPTANRS